MQDIALAQEATEHVIDLVLCSIHNIVIMGDLVGMYRCTQMHTNVCYTEIHDVSNCTVHAHTVYTHTHMHTAYKSG